MSESRQNTWVIISHYALARIVDLSKTVFFWLLHNIEQKIVIYILVALCALKAMSGYVSST